jgi:hypothetical protein
MKLDRERLNVYRERESVYGYEYEYVYGAGGSLTSRSSRRGPRRFSGNGRPHVSARAAERRRSAAGPGQPPSGAMHSGPSFSTELTTVDTG